MKRFSHLRHWLRICALPLVIACAAPALASCGGAPASARTAQRHLVRGDYVAATAAAERSIAKHPKDPTSWRVRIRSAMAQGKLELAASHYQEWKTLRGSHDRTTYRIMATATLWQGLRVPSPEVNARAITIIAKREVEKLATDVRDALGNDNDLVAATAAIALMRSHPAAPDLASELLVTATPRIRALLIAGIAKKVGRVALGDIAPLLRDPDSIVRRAAVSAIAKWKNAKDSPRLIALATSDSDAQVRSRALRGLLAKGGDGVVALAQTSLTDEYPGARLAAFALLERYAKEEALAKAGHLAKGEDTALAMRSAVMLHEVDGTSQAPVILRVFASADWANRAAALNTAAQVMNEDEAMSLATKGLGDDHADVRFAAARLLVRLGDTERGTAALVSALSESTLAPRLAAATELARTGHREAIELLGSLARSGTAEQRLCALAAHATAGVVSDGLVAALGDGNIDVRLAAADALFAD